MGEDAATHYENITDIWKEFMGDNFHFGYFETEDMDLEQAAEKMIDKLLEPCDLSEESRVLDVGCGIGGPALFIHERHGCAVDGISTSERGVRIANQASKDKGYDRVRFKVADGMDNGFLDDTFDLVWIMEASHPIPDKKALFGECYRVLKTGGMLAMCDLVQAKILPLHKGFWYFIKNIREFLFAPNVWGPARILSMGNLCDHMVEAGFARVDVKDITQKAIPTLRHWRENALNYREEEDSESSRQYLDDFAKGCANLEKTFNDGIMGYGMLFARKES
jgi:cyclopropane fatty-acyl-phospholipid synthase-like methyltransferase